MFLLPVMDHQDYMQNVDKYDVSFSGTKFTITDISSVSK